MLVVGVVGSCLWARTHAFNDSDGRREELAKCGTRGYRVDGNRRFGINAVLIATSANAKSLSGKLPIRITNAVHEALAQVLPVSGDVLVGEKARNKDFERVKNGRDRMLEELNVYMKEKKNL